MAEVSVPTLGESVTEATVGQWMFGLGDHVNKDQAVVALETDKVSVEVAAPLSGILSEIIVPEGETVEIGAVLAKMKEASGRDNTAYKKPVAETESAPKSESESSAQHVQSISSVTSERPVAPSVQQVRSIPSGTSERPVAPSVRRIANEAGLDPQSIPGSGKGGRATKADALSFIAKPVEKKPFKPKQEISHDGRVERVRMTRLRQTIASRLKEAQNTAAILTTFNDVDMSNIMSLRSEYKDVFLQKHDVKLGFMGFFVKATVAALQEIPAVNAEIDGTDIIYRHYCNISVAVGTDKGLVTPVVRDADQMSIADIEKAIGALGRKARDGKLAMDDLQGGTFTISNGGVYGSLMSTPIINPPQSGVLGMHRIEDRPVVVNKEIVIRPMMYLALSYDHRIVDGKDAVTFLVRVKEAIEDPKRLLLEV